MVKGEMKMTKEAATRFFKDLATGLTLGLVVVMSADVQAKTPNRAHSQLISVNFNQSSDHKWPDLEFTDSANISLQSVRHIEFD